MRRHKLLKMIWILLLCVTAFGIWDGRTMQVEAAHAAHPICGKASSCVSGTKVHPTVTWQAWDGSSSFSGSHVYLSQDAEWTNGTFSVTGDVTICLNGHSIEFDNGINIKSGTTLSFCDCTGGGKVTGDSDIFVSGNFYVWGGSIENYIQVQSGGHAFINEGTVSELYNNSANGKVNIGSITGKTCKVTTTAYNKGTMVIQGGTVTDLCCEEGSLTEISGSPKIVGLSAYDGSTLYLGGKPTITDYYFNDSAVLYASDQDVTSYYEGSVLSFAPRSANLVSNIKDQAHMAYFSVKDSMPHRETLSGTDLVCKIPTKTGSCGTNLKWGLWDDGTLELYGSGDMTDYTANTSPWSSYTVKKLTVWDQVTSIGEFAFYDADLESISFGAASLALGDSAFYKCSSLTDIDFGSGTITPGQYTFQKCTSLKSLHLTSNVNMTGKYTGAGSGYDMFMYCENLESAVIDCAYLGPYVFEGCKNLKTVTFTDPDVDIYCLQYPTSLNGYIFNTEGQYNINITLIAYECSRPHFLSTLEKTGVTLSFQAIDGDTTKHTLTTVSGKAATCTTSGISDGEKCTKCGMVLKEQETISALGHDYGDWETVTEATCTQAGSEQRVCSRCQDTEVEEIAALGHDYGNWETVTEATCTQAGSKQRVCSRCQDAEVEEIAALGHDWEDEARVDQAATCTAKGSQSIHCKNCSETKESEEIVALGHDYGDWETVTEATCTQAGSKQRVCSRCQDAEVEEIPLIDHNYVNGQCSMCQRYQSFTSDGMVYEVNCSEDGNCKVTLISDNSAKSSSVTIPEQLTVDGVTYTVTEIGAKAFQNNTNLEDVIIPETVTKIESGAFEGCSNLANVTFEGEKAPEIAQDAFNNISRDVKVNVPDGASGYTDIDAIHVHKVVTWAGEDATCVKTGWTSGSYCETCGKVIVARTVIPFTDHVWNHGNVTVQPTYTANGTKVYKCTVCGSEKRENIAKLAPILVKSVKITGDSKQIAMGKKITLKATVSPSNATNKKLVWKSSNTKIAKVSSKGVVTVLNKTGGKTVVITATATDGSGKKATYKIKSMKGIVKKIVISGSKTVKAGKTITLKAKVTATKGANKTVIWSSGNSKYATVSKGKVKTLAAGKGKTVTITARAADGSGKKSTYKVKIK